MFGNRLSRNARGALLIAALTIGLIGISAVPAAAHITTAACAKEKVNGGKYLGQLTLRFGLVGRVSCAEAHHLARTYFHKFATGQCGQQNNFCDLTFKGWSCSFFFATEAQQTGGAKAGCARQQGRAKVRFYWRGGGSIQAPDKRVLLSSTP